MAGLGSPRIRTGSTHAIQTEASGGISQMARFPPVAPDPEGIEGIEGLEGTGDTFDVPLETSTELIRGVL